MNSRTNCYNSITALLGVGCSGAYLLNMLSKKHRIEAFEAGWSRFDDGFTYNIAARAPAVPDPLSSVAAHQPLPFPQFPPQWNGVVFALPYSITTPVQQTNPDFVIGNWTQGIMIGGSNEHIQGLFVNPSHELCNRWAGMLDDPAYRFREIFPHLEAMESFRAHTNPTTQTYNGEQFAPLDGPLSNGPFPINRGSNGVIQVMQTNPSSYSVNLARAIYNEFIGTHKFKMTPIIENNNSITYNSGVNLCVTTAPEYWVDRNRSRCSIARNYLNDTVMVPSTDPANSVDTPNPLPDNSGFYQANNGIFTGVNGHDFTLQSNTLIQRIVFETIPGVDNADGSYWMPHYYFRAIKWRNFKHPLKAVGIIVCDNNTDVNGVATGCPFGEGRFIPCDNAICTLGVLATPALLMQSGIGPEDVLENASIPCLFDQPNMGRYISNHNGSALRWDGDPNIWGITEPGKTNSHGYLPRADTGHNDNMRKFQYYSGHSPNGTYPWSMLLYDLHPKSTGWLEIEQPWEAINPLLKVKITPNYYSVQEDIDNLTNIIRRCGQAVLTRDPTAVFNVDLDLPDDELFKALMVPVPGVTGLNQQSHYVGSCGMGNDRRIHCVNKNFKLRGTCNVFVCDASSIPLDVDCDGNIFPIQNDGNTSRSVNTFSIVCSQKLLGNL